MSIKYINRLQKLLLLTLILLFNGSPLNAYELKKSYLYEYTSNVDLGYSKHIKYGLNKVPFSYDFKADFKLEVKKNDGSIVEFVAKIENGDGIKKLKFYSEDTIDALLNEAFGFEFDKTNGEVLSLSFSSRETQGSRLFKKSFVDHFNYINKTVFICEIPRSLDFWFDGLNSI